MPLKYRAKFNGKWYEVLTIDLTTQTATIPVPDLVTGENTKVGLEDCGRATEVFDAYGRELYIGDLVLAPVIDTDKPGTEDPEGTCIFKLSDYLHIPGLYNHFMRWQYPNRVAGDGKYGPAVIAHLYLHDMIMGVFADKPLSKYEVVVETGFLKNVRALRNDDRALPDYVYGQEYVAWFSGAFNREFGGPITFNPDWIDFSKLPLPEKKKEPRMDTVVLEE